MGVGGKTRVDFNTAMQCATSRWDARVREEMTGVWDLPPKEHKPKQTDCPITSGRELSASGSCSKAAWSACSCRMGIGGLDGAPAPTFQVVSLGSGFLFVAAFAAAENGGSAATTTAFQCQVSVAAAALAAAKASALAFSFASLWLPGILLLPGKVVVSVLVAGLLISAAVVSSAVASAVASAIASSVEGVRG